MYGLYDYIGELRLVPIQIQNWVKMVLMVMMYSPRHPLQFCPILETETKYMAPQYLHVVYNEMQP